MGKSNNADAAFRDAYCGFPLISTFVSISTLKMLPMLCFSQCANSLSEAFRTPDSVNHRLDSQSHSVTGRVYPFAFSRGRGPVEWPGPVTPPDYQPICDPPALFVVRLPCFHVGTNNVRMQLSRTIKENLTGTFEFARKMSRLVSYP